LIEPGGTLGREKVLENLAKHLLFIQLYHLILEANASEHSARRMAMKTASDNASDLGEKLNLQYNKSRQSKITTEISEISAGAEALS
jgi:F-type H+-transporting ATPase subunit gamma